MNHSDSEIIQSLLARYNYSPTTDPAQATFALINTCAIREKAELKVISRLKELRTLPQLKVGVLGCMAERMKEKLITEGLAHLVVGPDAYRALPGLLSALLANSGSTAINVQLSTEETYADIVPLRKNGVLSYLSIMRGCNNMCSFCVVPFTRGRERSRGLAGIVNEVKELARNGTKEVTLLGQNVNSYHDLNWELGAPHENSAGFKELYTLRGQPGARFADLLSAVAEAAPNMRIRFISPHPKDFPMSLIQVIRAHPNICRQIHLPLQSGSDHVLQRMRRLYSKASFIELAGVLRRELPGVALSTDVIAGFCGETLEDHEETLDVLKTVKFEQAFTFAYSMREKTHAFNNMEDNVHAEEKQRRLAEIIACVREITAEKNQSEVGKDSEVLVEGPPRKGRWDWVGRTEHNRRVVGRGRAVTGDLVRARILTSNSQTLFGEQL